MHHSRVAKVLEVFMQELKTSNRKLMLEVAYHFDMALEHVSAAKYFLASAHSLFTNGALSEAAEICERALKNVRFIPTDYHLHAEIIELFLIITENRWKAVSDGRERSNSLMLANEGFEAAMMSADISLSSRLLCLRGLVILFSQNLQDGVKIMQDSLQLIRQTNDPVSEFIIMSNLGYWMRSGGFSTGLKMQWEALSLYKEKIEDLNSLSQADLKRRFYALQRQIGIGEFDQGNYGLALTFIEQSILGTRQIKARDDLISLLNNLAQVYTAIGFFSQSESCLREAILLSREGDMPHTWNPYNLASLGKLYLEWGRLNDSISPILLGLKESEITQITWELPLIRTIYAELLMSPLYLKRDLLEAKRQLDLVVVEATKYGLNRSMIVALSLKSLICLYEERIQEALTFSTEAVTRLESLGNLPAIRVEEIFFIHYQVNKAASRPEIAFNYLNKAHDLVQSKAASLTNLSQRESFLFKITLNVNIISTYQTINSKRADF